MCGILGLFVKSKKSLDSNFNLLFKDSLNKLDHRGPDDVGIESYSNKNGQLFLGHKRLSIIDLSKDGHQPMKMLSGRYSIIFNGEIYNYLELRKELENDGFIFKTKTDTEVLLAAWIKWGENSLKRFIGMFSFAIFDQEKNSIFLARDPFGIKPIYYYQNENYLIFGSELKAFTNLIPIKININLKVVSEYLLNGIYDRGESTFFDNYYSLQPGHLIKVDLSQHNKINQERWYIPKLSLLNNVSIEKASRKVRELFLESINLHLRGDVPTCISLSGGLDSSAIACAVRYINPKSEINTFSYCPQGYDFNEEKWIDIINNHIKAIPHKFTIKPNEIIENFPSLIESQDEPFSGSSIYCIFRTFAEASKFGYKVMLDGQGSDELFAGYHGYPYSYAKDLYNDEGIKELIVFCKEWSKMPNRGFKKAINIFASTIISKHTKLRPRIVQRILRRIKYLNYFSKSSFTIFKDYTDYFSPNFYENNFTNNLFESLTYNGLPNLLRTGDRSSMANSIESRVPFLNILLMEFVLSLPNEFLLSKKGTTKYILRKALNGIVPDEILNRKDKIGAITPNKELLKSLVDFYPHYLEPIFESNLINEKILKKSINKLSQNKNVDTDFLWRIFNVSSWCYIKNINLDK